MTQEVEKKEKTFNKYATRGSYHWKEMQTKDVRLFNAYHQAHYDWILRIAGDVHGKKVLDIGCGDGVLSYLFAKAGAHVTGIDNEEYGLKFARENLDRASKNEKLHYTFVNGSAYELPFESESFDIVVSCEVIEHVREPERLVSEASRVLRKGGRFVVTTPHRLTEFPVDPHHVVEYFPGELTSLLEMSLSDVVVKQTHHLLWYALYTYSFTLFGNRPVGKWFINGLTLFFRWNPFLIDYEKPTKLSLFSTLCAQGSKR